MKNKFEWNPLTIKETIADNEKWFNFFVILPKILTIITAILYFIWGFVASFAFTYIFDIDSVFVSIVIWWLIGAGASILIYVVTKISCSFFVLHIFYLKSILTTQETIRVIAHKYYQNDFVKQIENKQ